MRTPFELPAIWLVAEVNDVIAGLIDIEIDGAAETIDTIAVHPDPDLRRNQLMVVEPMAVDRRTAR